MMRSERLSQQTFVLKGLLKNTHLLRCPKNPNPHIVSSYAPVVIFWAPCT